VSTILKALRRLEQEKEGRADRPLREQIAGATAEAAPAVQAGPRRWIILAGGVAGGVAAGLAILFFVGGDEAAPPETASPETAGATAGANRRLPRAAAAPAQRARPLPGRLPADELPPQVAVVPREPASPRLVDDPDPLLEPPRAPAAASPPGERRPFRRGAAARALPGGHRLPGDEPGTAQPEPGALARAIAPAPEASERPIPGSRPGGTPEPALVPPTPPTPEALPEPAPAPPTPETVPELAALPEPAPAPPTPETVPEPAPPPPAPQEEPVPAPKPVAPASAAVVVARTVWHPLPDRRRAVVELEGESRSVHEGDRVAGYLVETIEPSGIVLSRDGVALRRGIGER
jgi:hypothetical protein